MPEYNSIKQLQNEKRKSFLTILYVIVTLIAIIFLFIKCSATFDINSSTGNIPIVNTSWTKVTNKLNFPEGPAWDSKSNALHFSNCYGGWISKVSSNIIDTFLVASNTSFEKTNGMTFHNDFLYACDFGKGIILKISKVGESEIYAKNYKGKKFNNPNDLAFDKKGNLYFTDPKSYGVNKLDGRIFMVKGKTKEVVLVMDSLAFPNGIAFSSDGKNLFVCESAKNRILKFDVNKNGTLINKTEFVVLSGGDPDGITFDIKGNLYVAHFGTGHLFVINKRGEIIQKIKTNGLKPTNVEFGGEDMKTLFLTEVETNSLYKIRTKFPGLHLN